MTDSYPKMTIDEIEIWLASEVTKTYLQSLTFYKEQLAEARASGAFVGDTHDKTIERLYRKLGAEQAVSDFLSPIDLMNNYNLVRRSIDEE